MFRTVGEGVGDGRELLAGVTLVYLARRAESANGDSPHLLEALSGLVEPKGSALASEQDRARQASEEILKPLASVLLLDYLLKKRRQPTA
jgi:hypothetical protein